MLDALQTDPIAFTIPIGDGFPIYWYGILVVIGIAIGTFWASREIEKRNGDVDELYTGLLIAVISGYIFARLSYVGLDVLQGNAARYESFIDVINLRAGGANIVGGFIGAALVVIAYVRWRGLDVWKYADVVGPTILIAQAIGRWGNFINQELYGPPTELPWGILIEAPNRIAPYNDLVTYPPETRFHPTFLYESLWLLAGFFLLLYLNDRFRGQWANGSLFATFLIWWGGGRAWIEFFRPDQATIGDTFVTYSMVASLLLALVGVFALLAFNGKIETDRARRRRRRQRRLKPKPRRNDPTTENE
jgi:phosphatidylglycerol:prolipoprotein diacylglycerol transferase